VDNCLSISCSLTRNYFIFHRIQPQKTHFTSLAQQVRFCQVSPAVSSKHKLNFTCKILCKSHLSFKMLSEAALVSYSNGVNFYYYFGFTPFQYDSNTLIFPKSRLLLLVLYILTGTFQTLKTVYTFSQLSLVLIQGEPYKYSEVFWLFIFVFWEFWGIVNFLTVWFHRREMTFFFNSMIMHSKQIVKGYVNLTATNSIFFITFIVLLPFQTKTYNTKLANRSS
jgi:hypothetical protein